MRKNQGAKEEENNIVALRCRKEGDLGEMRVDELIEKLVREIKEKVLYHSRPSDENQKRFNLLKVQEFTTTIDL